MSVPRIKILLPALFALLVAMCAAPAAAFAESDTVTVGTSGTYQSLQEAFEYAADGDTILLQENVTVDTVITVDKAVTLDLNGFTITNNVQKDRPFSVTASRFTVEGTAAGSSMVIPESNTASYGFIKLMKPSVVTLNGGIYKGNTDSGSFVMIRNRPDQEGSEASGSTVVFNNANMTSNGQFFNTDTLSTDASTPTLQVTGGTYVTAGKAFGTDTIYRSPVVFTDVTVTAGTGPCIEVCGPEATFNNCIFTVTGKGSSNFDATAVAASWSGSVIINGGTYSAPNGYGVYVYNSGGIITVNSGTISGGMAAVRADKNVQTGNGSSQQSTVVVKGGETIGTWYRNDPEAVLSALGGSHTTDVSDYVKAGAAILVSEDNGTSLYSVYSSLEDALNSGGAYVVKNNDGTTWVFTDKEKADAFAEESGSEAPEAIMRTVVFDDRIDSTSDQHVEVLNGQSVAKPADDPVLKGYRFLGWYEYDSATGTYASEPFDFSMPIFGDVTLYAQWKEETSVDEETQGPVVDDVVSPDEQQSLPQTGDNQFTGIMIAGLVSLALVSMAVAVYSIRERRS